jgi:glycosyltransferase involved in cell wall biosynthesis
MKICLVGNLNSIHMQRFIRYFTGKNQYEIHIITSSPMGILWLSNQEDMVNVKPHLIGRHGSHSPFNFLWKIIQTRRIIKSIHPDVVHAHYAFGPGTFAAFSGFHPFVLSTWGSDIYIDTRSFWKRLLIRYALRKADAVTCEDHLIKDLLLKLGVKAERIKPFNFGVDCIRFKPSRMSS